MLTEADASALLGTEVERINFADLFERENGPVPQDELPAVKAAGEKVCSYAEVDGKAVVALQLDRGLFASVDEFGSAWDSAVEILTAPGLAASFDAEGGEHSGAVSVLLNDRGDSFALTVYRADVGRDELLDAASESTKRYSD